VDALKRAFHRGELGLHLLEDRQRLLALERVAGGVGGVLVDVGELARALLLGLVAEVVPFEHRTEPLEAAVLVAQVTPGVVGVHTGSVRRRTGRVSAAVARGGARGRGRARDRRARSTPEIRASSTGLETSRSWGWRASNPRTSA